MAAMYGADIEQLRSLATQFDRSADRLDADRMSVGNAIRISAWMGPVAMRFRSQWDSDHSRRLHEAAVRLRDAASALRTNAAQQERASAVGGASASAGVTPRDGRGADGGLPRGLPILDPSNLARDWAYRLEDWLRAHPNASVEEVEWMRAAWGGQLRMLFGDPGGVVDWMANSVAVVDGAGTLSEVFALGVSTPRVLGPLGVMFDTADAVGDAQNGDAVGALLSGGSAAAGVAATIAPIAGPLALGVSVGKTFVDWTLPYNAESQDATYAKGAEHMFGQGADADNLTAEQAQAMAKRYDGVWGVANMISDRMDATADAIFPWNWGK